MIFDLERDPVSNNGVYDVCIIGAGAAGITLAVELRRKGKRVLLLEGGGLRYETRTQKLYAGDTEGLVHSGLTNTRFRILGGTTFQWGGQVLEIDEHVFGARPWVPGGQWPFPKSELAPYYRRAISVEGLGRSLQDTDEIWQALDCAKPEFGDGFYSAFSYWCPVTDFSSLYAKELRQDADLSVYIHANALEFKFGDDGESAVAIHCAALNDKKAVFFAHHFVLCMGAVETSRFLLQPPSATNLAPWRDNPLIGCHFQDHLCANVATIANCAFEPAGAYFDYRSAHGMRYHPKMKLSPQVQERDGLLDICGTVVPTTKGGRDDLAVAFETFRFLRTRQYDRLTLFRLMHFAFNLPRLVWHKIPFSRQALGPANKAKQVLRLVLHVEQSPLSESRVVLVPKRDAFNQQCAKVYWRTSGQELHTVRHYIRMLSETFANRGLGIVQADPGVMDDDEVLAASFRDSSHHIGGTRMATSVADGVVDESLRIFNTRNVYICSSSVFPSAGFANPTHTIISLAIRLADHLAELI